ncbi:hypothetical protein NQ314_012585 [Rhamnusium bicolor]|uniref:Endonuclease n=1 Tax=Rhamnusium bicolor TaxID=1586634 RepID=A0AAV8XB00_9CUCU|nr:hypothetical protein NQ314_012585 [Rhamnusium bicolor]
MDENELYKYLGYEQTYVLEEKVVKSRIKERMQERMRQILKSSLSAINKTKAINTYAIPVAVYTFGTIKWTQTELEALDRQTRTLFTKYRTHHPKSSVVRFHLPRSQGGRGVLKLVTMHERQTRNLHKYFHGRAETSRLHNAIISVDNNLTPTRLNLPLADQQTRHQIYRQEIEQWLAKPLHGKTIHTDRHIPNNRPDIVFTNRQTRQTYLIDITIPLPENIEKKYREKISKYLPLAEDVKAMWRQEEVNIIPIVIGATGEIPVTLKPALVALEIKGNAYITMQKAVLIDTCSLTRAFLNQVQ